METDTESRGPESVLWRTGLIDAIFGPDTDLPISDRVQVYAEVADVALTRLYALYQEAQDRGIASDIEQRVARIEHRLTAFSRVQPNVVTAPGTSG